MREHAVVPVQGQGAHPVQRRHYGLNLAACAEVLDDATHFLLVNLVLLQEVGLDEGSLRLEHATILRFAYVAIRREIGNA
ncbi:MAG TPA: hypothetical protein VF524_04525 [Polyangia bacterium]